MTYTVTRRPRRALSAAVTTTNLSLSGMTVAEKLTVGRTQEWQQRAWTMWRAVGELHYPLSRLARAGSLVGFDVYADGELLEDEQRDELIAQVTAGIGEDEATRRLMLNLLVAGDGYYVFDGETFNVYAATTPSVRQLLDGAEQSWRVLNPDPVDPTVGDSSVRAALGPVEDLVLLESLSRAQSRSRIALAGVLLVGQDVEGADASYQAIVAAMSAAILDESASSAFAPVMIEWPDEETLFKHVTFDRSFDDKLKEKIELAQQRIAVALDIEPSLLTGMAEANHWSAWLTAEETYRVHIQPLVIQVGEVYAAVAEYLNEGTSFRFDPDPSQLLRKQSPVRDALDAHRLAVVSAEYVREQMGATEDDAPSDEDRAMILALAPRNRDATVAENPGAPVAAYGAYAAYGAAQVARDTVRAKLGAKLRSKLSDPPDVPNGDLVATVGLAAAASHLNLRDEVTRGLSTFDEWWTRQIGGTPPNLADHVLHTLGVTAANLDAINLDSLTDDLVEQDQAMLDELTRMLQSLSPGADLSAVQGWLDAKVRSVFAEMSGLGLDVPSDDWLPGLMAAKDDLVILTQQHWANGTPDLGTVARVVLTRAGG